jgi:SAM-dependent methyltransferase
VSDWLGVIVIVLAAAALIALAYWLLVLTEGIYLGQRVVTWLYDVYAGRYEDIKGFQPHLELQYVGQPLMQEIAPNESPLVLDVATGTGRVALALLRYRRFSGTVIGIDLSMRMMEIAARRTDAPNVFFAQAPAEQLPFPDRSFDAVTCLEALEFMRDSRAALADMCRVLKPGGVLMTTRRVTARWMPDRSWSPARMMDILEAAGFEKVEFQRWQVDYDLVWARRPGEPA